LQNVAQTTIIISRDFLKEFYKIYDFYKKWNKTVVQTKGFSSGKEGERMDVLSAKEASEKWGVHIRVVQRYCIEGRIPGAKKYGNNWTIPFEAKKPTDPRKQRLQEPPSYAYPPCRVMSGIIPLPGASLQNLSPSEADKIQRQQLDCEMAYVRGDFEKVKNLFADAEEDSPSKFYASSLAIAAAISTGDYDFYNKVDTFLQNRIANQQNANIARIAELFLATAPVSMFAPEMAPTCLEDGDFGAIVAEQKPFAFYLYAKYLQNTQQHAAMLAVAKTALALCAPQSGFTILDIYLRLLCACANVALGQIDHARSYIKEALDFGMPYGFITPFAEHVTGLSGLLEALLEQNYPDSILAVQEQWQKTFQNWVSFHNHFAKRHVADILTLKEYHIAQLLAYGASYAEAAQQMQLSLGALNNTVSVIYGKLFIQKKSELRSFLF